MKSPPAPRTKPDLPRRTTAGVVQLALAGELPSFARSLGLPQRERHLWQDLGVAGRETVSSLLEAYFLPLASRNTQNLKWKRFLFAELGAAQGMSGLRPPGCGKCDQLQICFPTLETSGS